MKATILQKDLAKTLSYASRFVSTRSQIPILANLKLIAKGAKLVIQATNLEMSISSSVGAKIEEEGEIAISARTLTDLVNNLRSEKILFDSDDGETLKIEAHTFKGKISGLNTADFPEIPESMENPIVLPKELFINGVAQTLFSASPDDTRPALSGILFLLVKDSLSLVSSDGFRLSKKEIALKDASDSKFIVPRAVLSEVSKISPNVESLSFSVNSGDKQIIFALDDTVISSRLVEGEYPPFERIIPANSSTVVNVDKDDFENAIKIAAIFAREGANIVKLELSEESLNVSAESSKSGKEDSKVEAKIEGPMMSILYNYRYIEEFLAITKGESVSLKLNGPNASGLFLDPNDPNYLHLIMPVKS